MGETKRDCKRNPNRSIPYPSHIQAPQDSPSCSAPAPPTVLASSCACGPYRQPRSDYEKKGGKERRTEEARVGVVPAVERVEERRVGDGEEDGDDDEREGHHPAHPRERDEHGQQAALPELVAPEEVAPERLWGRCTSVFVGARWRGAGDGRRGGRGEEGRARRRTGRRRSRRSMGVDVPRRSPRRPGIA